MNEKILSIKSVHIFKNTEIRSLKHFSFKCWTDHSIPSTCDIMVNFVRLIRSQYRPDQDGPLLVHCSAGVGRSGTFIALDQLIQKFDQSSDNDSIDVYSTVVNLRRFRDKMVQNQVNSNS